MAEGPLPGWLYGFAMPAVDLLFLFSLEVTALL